MYKDLILKSKPSAAFYPGSKPDGRGDPNRHSRSRHLIRMHVRVGTSCCKRQSQRQAGPGRIRPGILSDRWHAGTKNSSACRPSCRRSSSTQLWKHRHRAKRAQKLGIQSFPHLCVLIAATAAVLPLFFKQTCKNTCKGLIRPNCQG